MAIYLKVGVNISKKLDRVLCFGQLASLVYLWQSIHNQKLQEP